ncbi:hypothetical protein [Salinibacterium sp. ZJ77]|uniref:WXG100-like domain-containing protein n=1 Tax=Salinibacterium sp. ZJ77 TaxID=2708337 RepID=UPI00141F466B|nr:hypothetical protein [Salinibacterium sp. ZJ77]
MTTIRVEPHDYATASDQFGTITGTALANFRDARDTLRQFAAMAGDDPGGEQFASAYDENATAILRATRNLAVLTSQIDRGLTATATVHHNAECAAAGKPAGGGFTLRGEVVEYDAAPPPSAFGGSPNSTPDLWGMLKDAVGMIWPNANTSRLRRAATAWGHIADDLDALARAVRLGVDTLTGNRSGEVSRIGTHVSELAADITGLAGCARDVGASCSEYADAVDEAHAEVMAMVGQLAAEIAIGAGISVALSFVSFGAAGAIGAGAIATRVIFVGGKIAHVLSKVIRVSASVSARFRGIVTHIRGTAERFEKTFRIGIEVASGTGSALIVEGAANGKDANLLAAGLSGFGGGLLSGGISAAFSTRTLNLLGKIGAGSVGGTVSGGASGAIDSLIRDGKLDLKAIVLGAAMGGVGGTIGGGFDGLLSRGGGHGGPGASASPDNGDAVSIATDGGPNVGGGSAVSEVDMGTPHLLRLGEPDATGSPGGGTVDVASPRAADTAATSHMPAESSPPAPSPSDTAWTGSTGTADAAPRGIPPANDDVASPARDADAPDAVPSQDRHAPVGPDRADDVADGCDADLAESVSSEAPLDGGDSAASPAQDAASAPEPDPSSGSGGSGTSQTQTLTLPPRRGPSQLSDLTPRQQEIIAGTAPSGPGWVRVSESPTVIAEAAAYNSPKPSSGIIAPRYAVSPTSAIGRAATLLRYDAAQPWGHQGYNGPAHPDQASWDAVYVHPSGDMHFAPNGGAVIGTRVSFTDLNAFRSEFGNLPIDRLGDTRKGTYMGIGGGTFDERGLPPGQRHATSFTMVDFAPGAKLPAGHHIEISLIADAYGRDGGGLQVVVYDSSTGEGVPLDALERLGIISMRPWF